MSFRILRRAAARRQVRMRFAEAEKNSPVVDNISVFARYDLMGDADADGALTVSDALMILRHAMGLSELPENRIALCDFDNSGDISAADALTAMRNAL